MLDINFDFLFLGSPAYSKTTTWIENTKKGRMLFQIYANFYSRKY